MPHIKELFELARQCYVQANATLNPDTKEALLEMGAKYAQKASELSRVEITQAVFPNDKK